MNGQLETRMKICTSRIDGHLRETMIPGYQGSFNTPLLVTAFKTITQFKQ
jgi:hypothetical protein